MPLPTLGRDKGRKFNLALRQLRSILLPMTITRKIVLNEQGQPSEVIIPYDQYIDIIESFGMDLSAQSQEDLRVAMDDSIHGRHEAFVGGVSPRMVT